MLLLSSRTPNRGRSVKVGESLLTQPRPQTSKLTGVADDQELEEMVVVSCHFMMRVAVQRLIFHFDGFTHGNARLIGTQSKLEQRDWLLKRLGLSLIMFGFAIQHRRAHLNQHDSIPITHSNLLRKNFGLSNIKTRLLILAVPMAAAVRIQLRTNSVSSRTPYGGFRSL